MVAEGSGNVWSNVWGSAGGTGDARFEISVAGALGPVMRHALRPCSASGPTFGTIVRVTADADTDLVEVVARLESCGLELTDVVVVA